MIFRYLTRSLLFVTKIRSFQKSLNSLFPHHYHRKSVGFLECKLADATETDRLHLRFLDAIVDELLGDVAGTGNAQRAVTFSSSGSFVGIPRDVDGQMMLLGILGDLCEEYYRFSRWEESVVAYQRMIQYRYKGGNYFQFLKRIGYAKDPRYIVKLARMVKSIYKDVVTS